MARLPWLLLLCALAADAQPDFPFRDFSSTAGLRFAGSAQRVHKVLRLTAAERHLAGAVWFERKQSVSAGFDTAFQFQLTGQGGLGPGANGFAFVLQNSGPEALGGAVPPADLRSPIRGTTEKGQGFPKALRCSSTRSAIVRPTIPQATTSVSLGCSAGSCGRTNDDGVNYWGRSIRRENELTPQVGFEPRMAKIFKRPGNNNEANRRGGRDSGHFGEAIAPAGQGRPASFPCLGGCVPNDTARRIRSRRGGGRTHQTG